MAAARIKTKHAMSPWSYPPRVPSATPHKRAPLSPSRWSYTAPGQAVVPPETRGCEPGRPEEGKESINETLIHFVTSPPTLSNIQHRDTLPPQHTFIFTETPTYTLHQPDNTPSSLTMCIMFYDMWRREWAFWRNEYRWWQSRRDYNTGYDRATGQYTYAQHMAPAVVVPSQPVHVQVAPVQPQHTASVQATLLVTGYSSYVQSGYTTPYHVCAGRRDGRNAGGKYMTIEGEVMYSADGGSTGLCKYTVDTGGKYLSCKYCLNPGH